MRQFILAAVSALTLAIAAPALAQDAVTDAELTSFAGAMERIQAVTASGGTPEEQQAAMADAVEASGLEISRFNAISSAVSNDAVVRARIAVLTAPESPAGSVGAGVTDQEAAQFAEALADIRAVSESGATGDDQQRRMAEAITEAGLELERFNAISAATGDDERLRARIALESARAGG